MLQPIEKPSYALSIKNQTIGMKKMKNINKTKILSTMIALVLMISSIMMLSGTANAAIAEQQPTSGAVPAGVTPDATAYIKAYLSFSPTVVGLGQPVLVNVWTTPAPGADRRQNNYTVTITAPNGTKYVRTMDSYVADGTAWFSFKPDQTGEWKLKFDFAGEYFPEGRYVSGNIVNDTTGGSVYTESVYYEPSSTQEQVLTVQEGIVSSFPAVPLPTDYWTRPVQPNNREWWSILGNFPWANGNTHDYAGPFVVAPNSAHVVWRRQGIVGGLIGGDSYQSSIDASQSIGAGAAGNPSVIYSGRAYSTYAKAGVGNVAACYDIRTGQVFYEIPVAQGGTTPTVISYSTSAMSTGVDLLSIGARLLKIDPWTGLVTTNVTGMAGTFHSNNYVLSVQNAGNNTNPNYRLINWTTTGTSSNFTSRIVSNISWPMSSLGTVYDLNTGVSVNIISTAGAGGAYVQQTLNAYNIKTGASIWNATIDGGYYSATCDVADNGKVAVLVDRGYFVAFDLLTGTKAWQSETMDYPWDAPAFGAYDIGSAYGMIFRSAYSGVYAFNWTNGKIAWKFESPVPYAFETPYTNLNGTSVYSFNGAMLIADGKIYTYNTEHSPSEPITRGWRLFAINATSGVGLWNITAYSGSRTFRGAVADGYLAFDNFYDGYMYVYGKGQSSTTVSAPVTTVQMGSSVLIQGSVLDQSPAQPNTPCVSKDSMSTQMEYLHMQASMGGVWGNATIVGVPVTLIALDSNGNSHTIGTVTTNGYYGTYSATWTPPQEGTYTILATFAGDDSYGSSTAATALSISAAPQSTPTATPTAVVNTPYELYIVGMGIAVIIAVVVVGLLFRKRA